MQNYIISSTHSIIRWNNWHHFVQYLFGKKKSNIAMLTIHFNNFLNIQYLLDYTNKTNIDFIIIENSTKDEEIAKLEDYVAKQAQNITIIKPIYNIGSAGGYALGMEYIINSNYDYFYIIEDDVIFLEENTVKYLVDNIDLSKLSFINNCKNTWDSITTNNKGHSRRVQVAGYPTDFIKKIGIIDPRYFFRGEDLERGYKVECGIKKYKYKITIYDKNYIHPYLKPINKNYSFAYFSIRNQLFSLIKNGSKFKGILLTLYVYICSGLSKTIMNGNIQLIKSILLGVKDFLRMDYSFKNNLNNIGSFINSKENVLEKHNIVELKNIISNCYGNKNIMQITGYNNEMLPSYSRNILTIFYGIITSSNSTALSFLTLLSKHIINIETITINDEKFYLTYKNKSIIEHILGLIVFLPLLVIGLCIYIPILISILYIMIINKTVKK